MSVNQDLNVNIKTNTDFSSLQQYNRAIKEQKDAIIELRNKYGDLHPSVKKAEDSLRGLQSKLEETKQHLKDVGNTSKMSGFQLAEFGENITVISAGITQAIGYLKQYGQELWEISKKGADFGVLRSNFVELSGGIQQAEENMTLLKSAVAGNMDEEKIMGTVNKYKLLGFTITDTALLMDGIETRGDQMKVTFEEGQKAFESYVMSGRDRVLKTLGINAGDAKKAFEELVKATGKSVDQLSEEEKQALRVQVVFKELNVAGKDLNEVLNKPLDNADKLADIENRWKNIKNHLSEVYSEQTIGSIDRFNKKLKDHGAEVKEGESAATKLLETWGKFTAFMDEWGPGALLMKLDTLIKQGLDKVIEGFNSVASSVKGFFNSLKENPNMTWVTTVIDGIKDIYNWAKDTVQEIFNIKDAKNNVNTENEFSKVTDKDRKEASDYERKMRSESDDVFYTKDGKGHSKEWVANQERLRKERQNKRSGSSNTSNTSNNKSDPIQELIDGIKFALEYNEVFHNLTLDNINEFKKQLELERDSTDNLKEKLKLQQTLNDVNKVYIQTISFDKGKTFGSDISNDEIPKERTTYTNTGDSFIKKTLTELIFENRTFAIQMTEKIGESISNISGTLTSMMDTLKISANSFIGGLVSGFNKALSFVNLIVQALNTVNTISGIIGFVKTAVGAAATGGVSLAGAGMAGMTNINMPSLSNMQRMPAITVVVNSEVESHKAMKFFDNNFNKYQNYAKGNSF